MKTTLTIAAVLLVTALLLGANKFLPDIQLTLNGNYYINGLLKYQLFALVIATVVVLLTIKISPGSKTLLTFGNVKVTAAKEKWLGINGKSSWKSDGIQLLLFISLATGIFM